MSLVVRAIGAAAVAWLVPLGLGLYVFLSGPGTDASERPDNDPYRAAAFLLMLSPVFLAALSGYFLALTFILGRLNRLSVAWMLAVSLLVSVAFGTVSYRQGLAIGGVSDAVNSFLVFGFGAFLCLASGSFFWLWRSASGCSTG